MQIKIIVTASLYTLYAALFCINIVAQKTKPMVITQTYIPSGYMGDGGTMSIAHRDITRPDSTSVKVIYTPRNLGWGGIYWQYPDTNWCKRRGLDLSAYSRLTFYVRGETGNEVVKFKVGQDCGDTYAMNPPLTEKLTNSWRKITINLAGKNLKNISGAFAWIVDSAENQGKAITFYLDDIQYE